MFKNISVWRRSIVLLFALSILMIMTAALRADDPDRKPLHILFLTSYDSSYKWTTDVVEGFQEYLRRRNLPIKTDIVELNFAHTGGNLPEPTDLTWLERHLDKGDYDLIVASGNAAVELLLDNQAKLPENFPLIFCGYYDDGKLTPEAYPNLTGLLQKVDIAANVQLGMKLLPETRTIAIITDGTATGQQVQRDAREALKDFTDAELIFINSSDYSTMEMLQKVAELPADSFVIFNSWSSDTQEASLATHSLTQKLHTVSPGPIFSTTNSSMGFGILGGVMTDGSFLGFETAKLAERVLNGETAGSIPIRTMPTRVLFDWQLFHNNYQLNSTLTPPGAIFINQPPGLINVYRNWLIVALFVLVILLARLIFLQRSRRDVLKNMAIYEAFPFRLVVVDPTGKILFQQVEKELRQDCETIDQLPENLKEKFQESIDKVFASRQPQSLEYDFAGSRRRVMFSLFPQAVFDIDAVLWVSIDISELDTSREALAQLANRFKLTLESIGDGVIATDDRQLITLCNPVAATLIGRKAEALIGKPLDEVLHLVSYLDDRRLPSPVTHALERGEIVELANHTDLLALDGRRYHIADSAAPIRDMAGNIAGAVLVFRDVTKEYEQRNQLRMNNFLLTTAANTAELTYFKSSIDGNRLIEEIDPHYWGMCDGRHLDVDEWLIPEDRSEFRRQKQALLSGENSEMEMVYRSDYEGRRRYFYIRVMPSPAPEENKKVFFGIIQDITKARENEQKYHDLSNMLQSILDNLPCALFVKNFDDENRYIMGNPAYCSMLGRTSEEIIGRNDADLYDAATAARLLYADSQVMESGTSLDTVENIAVNGTERIYRTLKSRRQRTFGGDWLLGIRLDITEQKQLEDERLELLERLQTYVKQEHMINNCLEAIVINTDYNQAMNEILQIIGTHSNADRCYIFSFDYECATFSNDYEWTADGIQPEIDHLKDMPMTVNPLWNEALQSRQIIKTADLATDDTMPAIRESREILLAQNIKSLIVTGIWFGGRLWGYIGVDYVRQQHDFTVMDEAIMQAAVRIIEIGLERRRNMTDLESSEYEKRLIFDSIQIPIALFDTNMKLLRVNQAAAKLVGTTPENALTLPCHLTCCGHQEPPEYCPTRLALADSQSHQHPFSIRGRDFIAVANPIFNPGGQLTHVLESCIDVTDINENQRKLQAAMEAAQAADRAKSYFLATMSHELRTPLNAVIGFSELMQTASMSSEEQQEALQAIHFAGNTLLTMINDVLDLSRIEAGQVEIVNAPMDLKPAVRDIVNVFQARAKAKNIQMELRCRDDLPLLELDGMRLRQVLLNLVGNAVKFTDEGGITVTVDYELNDRREQSGTLRISICDTGSGVAPEYIEKIFLPFERQYHHVRGNRSYEGTGLGLPISQRLVDRMGGRIELKSALGQGSCFTVVLDGVVCRPNEDNVLPAKAPEIHFGNLLKVMIVDDVEMNLKVLGAMLKKLKVDYVTCRSGREALNTLRGQNDIQLILTDLWMPEMNGEELAHLLSQNPQFAAIPIVAVTADTQLATPEGPFSAVLFKPLTMKKLQDLLISYQ